MPQLWLFWVAPIAGALLGVAAYRFIAAEKGSLFSVEAMDDDEIEAVKH
jgi:hypothetical protein